MKHKYYCKKIAVYLLCIVLTITIYPSMYTAKAYSGARASSNEIGSLSTASANRSTAISSYSSSTELADTTAPDYVVGTEAELTKAIKKGGVIQLSADIKVKKALQVNKPTILDGGGYSIDGASSTNLFRINAVDFTIQNITLKNGNNKVTTGHFSERCGGAITVLGQSGKGSLKAIKVNFLNNKAARSSDSGDIAGGAVYIFAIPEAIFSGCKFNNNSARCGGAIGGLGSSLSILNCKFSNNTASGNSDSQPGTGGAIYLDGVDQNGANAWLKINKSTFTSNKAYTLGGAIFYVFHKPGDAGYVKDSKASIEKCTFEKNSLTSKSSGQGGAIYAQEGILNISSCTLNANTCFSQGAGLWFLSYKGGMKMTNCTIAQNKLTDKQFGMGGGIAIATGWAKITNTTIAENYAWFHGGGIQSASNDVTITNCILYNNRSTRDWAMYNTNQKLKDGGGNIDYLSKAITKDKKILNEKAAATARNVNPKLGELRDNGGSTKTMSLAKGSPAINAGVSSAVKYDQRGVERTGKPDVGAYEYN